MLGWTILFGNLSPKVTVNLPLLGDVSGRQGGTGFKRKELKMQLFLVDLVKLLR